MTYDQFEDWLAKLDPADREFLDKNPTWKKEHQAARKKLSLPRGFSEKTMEILEGQSESET